MPYPLHKSPVGLLELFRLRTLGANPVQFAEGVTPVVEASQFYSADLKQVVFAAATVGAGAPIVSALTLVTPARLHSMGLILTAGAAGLTNVSLSLRVVLNGAATQIGGSFQAALPATNQATIGVIIPGWVFRAQAVLQAVAWGTGAGVDHSLQVSALIDDTGTPA